MLVFHEDGLSFGCFLFFYQGGLLSCWFFMRMVSHQCALSSGCFLHSESGWSFIRLVFDEDGLSSVWSLIGVFFICFFSWWSLMRMVSIG